MLQYCFSLEINIRIQQLFFIKFRIVKTLCFLISQALRIKKKIESDINEMEISLDHSNKANAEMAKVIKRLAGNLLEIDSAVEEESRARADIEDQAGIAERKGKI